MGYVAWLCEGREEGKELWKDHRDQQHSVAETSLFGSQQVNEVSRIRE